MYEQLQIVKDTEETKMNIGAAAKQTGLPPKTIRYYDEIGLLSVSRNASGYRFFGAIELDKLAFIGRMRALGFSIEECRTLLSIWDGNLGPKLVANRIARGHIATIEQKISDLRDMKAQISQLISNRANC